MRISTALSFFLIPCSLLLQSCAEQEELPKEDLVDPEEVYEIPEPIFDSPEGMYIPPTPKGCTYTETAVCDSLSLDERIHIDTVGMGHLNITVADSIHISYLAVGNYCGFFEGNYEYKNDTIFIWDREDAWDGCGEHCLFVLEYVVPKPDRDQVVVQVNMESRVVELK